MTQKKLPSTTPATPEAAEPSALPTETTPDSIRFPIVGISVADRHRPRE